MKFKLEDEYIQLQNVLKVCGLVDSGAMAKNIIQDGLVKVNGEVETRRGKKIRVGDVVTVFDESIEIC
ncbi:RNA-binding protein [Anaerosphaera sp. HMSC064C01]|uniref:RNA-binding S4 domain-containing protein n=1 Tax=Fenollaria massiliensis TaxID=938288 RepID=A0A9E7IVG5_9FIRM|nr:RNA-binding S4 domain-containing protein [Fenollaria massiliensis]OFK81493.1 RNA-binding protein [Anaerosphaera sp. HMSC064C01]UQK59094.1 RNA-binding S4 domain-containing protein [Fenollaria massiliensis]